MSKKLILITLGTFIATLVIVYFGFIKEYEPHQPIAFSHKIHSGVNNIPCTYCHSYVAKSSQPGIPSVQQCMGCHTYVNAKYDSNDPDRIYEYNGEQIDPNNYLYDGRKRIVFENEIKKLTGYWDRKEPIVWVNYHYVAEHAKFPHKPHIRYGLECTTCHGNVENIDQPRPIVKMQMGWCISCHEEKLDINFKKIAKKHPGMQDLSDFDKRIMSYTGRIRADKLYKNYDHQLGDKHTDEDGAPKLININQEVAWLKDCGTCHY